MNAPSPSQSTPTAENASLKGIKYQWYHILLALADDDRHGNGIVHEVLKQTDGRLKLWPPMLFRCLNAMCDCGLLEELVDERRRPAASAKRRYFSITEKGKLVLIDETHRLSQLVSIAQKKLASEMFESAGE